MTKSLIEIEGFDELQRKIKLLADDKSKRREAISVLRKVAGSTVKVARNEAPVSKKAHVARKKKVSPGNLKKSIGVIVGRKGDAKINPTVYVGPRTKGKNFGFYGHFVEYGHNIYKAGFRRKRSSSKRAKAHNTTGSKSKTKANPFMGRAYNRTKGRVTADAEKSVARFIQKRIDKLSR
ncbi:MAG: hypothetical protein BM557_09550 [Flavobacterium sp. MedPE-SWcel]|uniref:HK97-gp10 family putative phage morphogenesis protein n=1 Tax=uncultured Flavobacterium sp. TaxID=165435 RepID=UPI0009196E66|nr:HK97-gp10 family putative phage morphogenesis protein [uncultured Flavobacterium sp.]OIQ16549.1 MAG: hypothetical protein BM557_09550 [Flavobacterium sp. MedPE-SWcel]